jgi:hypothetical protein
LLGTNTQLLNGAKAADAMIDRDGAAIVETHERAAFDRRLQERGASAEIIAEIGGFNYSKGNAVTLTIFRKAESGVAP